MTDAADPDRPPAYPSDDHLESWKEIAAYLRRDIKTVQRWEHREGLPVRRHVHDRQASVFALRSEIERWRLDRGRRVLAGDGASGANGNNGADGGTDRSIETATAEPMGERRDGVRPPPRPDDALVRAQPSPPTGARAARAAIALALLACGGLAGWLAGFGREAPHGREDGLVRFQVPPPPGASFAGNTESPQPALSPDGRSLVFRAAQDDTGRQLLYVRRMDRPETVPLEGTDNAIQPFWSPDSSQVGFFADGWLKTLDLASGGVRSVVRCAEPLGGAWLGRQIVYSPAGRSALMVVAEHGGSPAAFTDLNAEAGELRHSDPIVLPDLSVLYFVNHKDAERRGVAAVRRRRATPLWVVASPSMMAYSPAGYLLRFRSGVLIAHRFDAERLAVIGEPLALEDRIESTAEMGIGPQVSTAGGSLVYWDPRGGSLARLTWFDRQGRELGTVGPAGHYAAIDLSPHGDTLAVQRAERVGGAPDIWTLDLRGGGFTRLTAEPGNDEDPVWAPDSAGIAYARHRDLGQPADVYLLGATRPLEKAPLWNGERSAHPTDWSADGRWIVFQAIDRDRRSDIWLLPAGGGAATAVVRSEFDEMHGRLSPDSQFLAYTSDRSGRREVYLRRVAGDQAERQVSTAGGGHPRWRADGRELYYLSEQGHLRAVSVSASEAIQAGIPVTLFDARPVLPLVFSDVIYDAVADGTKFIVAAGPRAGVKPVTVVLNWPAALSR